MPKIQKGLSLLEIEIWRSLFVIYGFSKSHSFTPVHIGVFVDEFPLNQMDIFQLVGAPFVENCLAVFNSSIFAYGQWKDIHNMGTWKCIVGGEFIYLYIHIYGIAEKQVTRIS